MKVLQGVTWGRLNGPINHCGQAGPRWLHRRRCGKLLANCQVVDYHRNMDTILQGRAAVVAALVRPCLDDQEAVSADAVTRIQSVTLQRFLFIQLPLRGCQIGAELTLKQHVITRHHRARAV